MLNLVLHFRAVFTLFHGALMARLVIAHNAYPLNDTSIYQYMPRRIVIILGHLQSKKCNARPVYFCQFGLHLLDDLIRPATHRN
jgi:hypothetical protein